MALYNTNKKKKEETLPGESPYKSPPSNYDIYPNTDYLADSREKNAAGDFNGEAWDLFKRDEKIDAGYGGGYKKWNPYRYTNNYSNKISDLRSKLENYKPFTYDPYADDAFNSLRNVYSQNAKNASANTLAQVAAANGGRLSTGATIATDLAYQNKMAQLEGEIPALRNAAYEMYLGERNALKDSLNDYINQEATDYNRWNTNLKQYIDNSKYFNDQRAAEENDKYTKAKEVATMFGYAPEWVAEILGVDPGAQTSTHFYNMGSLKNDTTRTDTDAILAENTLNKTEADIKNQEVQNAIDMLRELGVADDVIANTLGIEPGAMTIGYRESESRIEDTNADNARDRAELFGTVSERDADILGRDAGDKTIDAQKYESDESQRAIDNAWEEVRQTGKVTSKETADALGLPVGTTSFELYKHTKEFDYGVTQDEQDNAWKEVNQFGEVVTDETAKILGVPVGTKASDVKMWESEFSEEKNKNAADILLSLMSINDKNEQFWAQLGLDEKALQAEYEFKTESLNADNFYRGVDSSIDIYNAQFPKGAVEGGQFVMNPNAIYDSGKSETQPSSNFTYKTPTSKNYGGNGGNNYSSNSFVTDSDKRVTAENIAKAVENGTMSYKQGVEEIRKLLD